MKKTLIALFSCLIICVSAAPATVVRGVDIDLVPIGNPGNPGHPTTGYGDVAYEYSIGTTEVTNQQWNDYITIAGGVNNSLFTGLQQPVGNVSWFHAAQFCNYLTSGDKDVGVYSFDINNTYAAVIIDRAGAEAAYGTIYFLPTVDEWYKAAYYTGDGYSEYANGESTLPPADQGWNYSGGEYSSLWDVGTGTQEQNGTYDMMGNFVEWTETSGGYVYRYMAGGSYFSTAPRLSATATIGGYNRQESGFYDAGFRIASNVPEPATLSLLALGGLALLRKRK